MVALAQHVEALGTTRYWLAEHHNMQSLFSSAAELLIAALSSRLTTPQVPSTTRPCPFRRPPQPFLQGEGLSEHTFSLLDIQY